MPMNVCCVCGLPVLDRTVGASVASQKRRWRLCEKDAGLQKWDIPTMAQWLAATTPNETDTGAAPFDPSKVVGASTGTTPTPSPVVIP